MPRDRQRVKRPFKTVAAAAMLAAALMSGFRDTPANAEVRQAPANIINNSPIVTINGHGFIKHTESIPNYPLGSIQNPYTPVDWKDLQKKAGYFWYKEKGMETGVPVRNFEEVVEYSRALGLNYVLAGNSSFYNAVVRRDWNDLARHYSPSSLDPSLSLMITSRIPYNAQSNAYSLLLPMDMTSSQAQEPNNPLRRNQKQVLFSRNYAGIYLDEPRGLKKVWISIRLPRIAPSPQNTYDGIHLAPQHCPTAIGMSIISEDGKQGGKPVRFMFSVAIGLLPLKAARLGTVTPLFVADKANIAKMGRTRRSPIQGSSVVKWSETAGIVLKRETSGSWYLNAFDTEWSHLQIMGKIKYIFIGLISTEISANFIMKNTPKKLPSFDALTQEQRRMIYQNNTYNPSPLYYRLLNPFIAVHPYVYTYIPSKLIKAKKDWGLVVRINSKKPVEWGKTVMLGIPSVIHANSPPSTTTIYKKVLAMPEFIDWNRNSEKHQIYKIRFDLSQTTSAEGLTAEKPKQQDQNSSANDDLTSVFRGN